MEDCTKRARYREDCKYLMEDEFYTTLRRQYVKEYEASTSNTPWYITPGHACNLCPYKKKRVT